MGGVCESCGVGMPTQRDIRAIGIECLRDGEPLSVRRLCNRAYISIGSFYNQFDSIDHLADSIDRRLLAAATVAEPAELAQWITTNPGAATFVLDARRPLRTAPRMFLRKLTTVDQPSNVEVERAARDVRGVLDYYQRDAGLSALTENLLPHLGVLADFLIQLNRQAEPTAPTASAQTRAMLDAVGARTVELMQRDPTKSQTYRDTARAYLELVLAPGATEPPSVRQVASAADASVSAGYGSGTYVELKGWIDDLMYTAFFELIGEGTNTLRALTTYFGATITVAPAYFDHLTRESDGTASLHQLVLGLIADADKAGIPPQLHDRQVVLAIAAGTLTRRRREAAIDPVATNAAPGLLHTLCEMVL